MRVLLTGELDWDTKTIKVIDKFYDKEFINFFKEKNYIFLSKVVIVVVCGSNDHLLKVRKRYIKKTKELSMDVFLNYNKVMNMDFDSNLEYTKNMLINELKNNLILFKIEDKCQDFFNDFVFILEKITNELKG